MCAKIFKHSMNKLCQLDRPHVAARFTRLLW